MWVFYAVFTAFLIYYFWQLPPEWRKWRNAWFWGVNFVGFAALIVLISCFYLLPNGWFRKAVLYTESAYFVLLAFTLAFGFFRQTSYYPLRHLAGKRVVRFFADRRIFMGVILACSVLYCAVGFRQMEELKLTPYEVSIDRSCEDSELRIALMADLHIGAGASYEQIERAVKLINEAQADVIILAGDIADSSSSRADLEHLCDALTRMESRCGIYYAEGNHDGQCHFDSEAMFSEIGVHILHDSAEYLPNGAAILGRCDARKTAVSEIRSACGIGEEDACIVLQHRPQGLKALAGTADLVLCGHTHGLQMPLCTLFQVLGTDLMEGVRSIGNTQYITTVGVAAWGFHCTWPSGCEVALVDVHFTGGNADET